MCLNVQGQVPSMGGLAVRAGFSESGGFVHLY